ncbi:hypothetical protein DSO57_1006610 [Entomophthora muscae]|uniref:Uncharacterized protein n=1 Tax=Entomophthora muscae TaxID=34485 RepID=A0ACC2T7U6_9FUNG|nr:hypothetical protein DSO57_1006610 [Entomophthora muscae]
MDHTKTKTGTGSKKNFFAKEMPLLLYGFGDVEWPLPETCETMESILIDFITDVSFRAHGVATRSGGRKVKIDDYKVVLGNDPKKLARVEELLYMHEDIRQAKMLFDQDEVMN